MRRSVDSEGSTRLGVNRDSGSLIGGSSDRSGLAFAPGAAILALIMWSGTAIANKVAVASISGATAGILRSMLAGLIALALATLLRLPFPRSPPFSYAVDTSCAANIARSGSGVPWSNRTRIYAGARALRAA
jgi:hypothetical protein